MQAAADIHFENKTSKFDANCTVNTMNHTLLKL